MTRVTGTLSTTFGSWKDRLTYIVAEAQILVAGLLMSAAITLLWIRPSVPGVPPIFMGWMAVVLLLGPPIFGFFVGLIRKLRTRNMVSVHHVNAVDDILKKYYVEPDLWSDKQINGPSPYPVNGGDGWAVQEFEFDEEMEQIRVKGIWLEETSDTQLLTEKAHMHSIYDTLTKSHIALQIMRDSISELGADIQSRLTNRSSEARERGKLMDKSAVKDIFEEFEGKIENTGPDDLPTIDGEETEETPAETESFEPTLDGATAAADRAAATDGGTEQ